MRTPSPSLPLMRLRAPAYAPELIAGDEIAGDQVVRGFDDDAVGVAGRGGRAGGIGADVAVLHDVAAATQEADAGGGGRDLIEAADRQGVDGAAAAGEAQ